MNPGIIICYTEGWELQLDRFLQERRECYLNGFEYEADAAKYSPLVEQHGMELVLKKDSGTVMIARRHGP